MLKFIEENRNRAIMDEMGNQKCSAAICAGNEKFPVF